MDIIVYSARGIAWTPLAVVNTVLGIRSVQPTLMVYTMAYTDG